MKPEIAKAQHDTRAEFVAALDAMNAWEEQFCAQFSGLLAIEQATADERAEWDRLGARINAACAAWGPAVDLWRVERKSTRARRRARKTRRGWA